MERWRGQYIVVPALALLVFGLVGCGAKAQFPTLPGNSSHAAVRSFINWDQCLRQHDVKVPTGFDLYTNTGPKLNIPNAAGSACQRYLPPAPPPSQAARQKLITESNCMRARGFANTVTYSGGGVGIVFGAGLNPGTPGFTAAMKACGLPAYNPPGS